MEIVVENMELDPVVRGYYYQSFKKSNDQSTGFIVDDGCYEYIFVEGTEVLFEYGKGKKVKVPHCFSLNGVMPPFKFVFEEELRVFGIKFQPWMNATFIPNDGNHGVIDLRHFYGQGLEDRVLYNFRNFEFKDMIRDIASIVQPYNRPLGPDVYLVKGICERIWQRDGCVSVSDLSQEFGKSRQDLNRIFKLHVKYTLKYFTKLVRMRAVLSHLITHKIPLTEAALKFGYYDQSHFNNDFRKICGTYPKKMLKSVFYSLNDLR